ncbi:MAG: preprotein translocase subunit SecE [Treponema sp.]|nr:preprotein translocase subunit SecE [Treponema sp.]
MVQFCKECVGELRKVTWPTRSEVVASVKVVLVSTIFLAVTLGFLDWLFVEGMRLLFK